MSKPGAASSSKWQQSALKSLGKLLDDPRVKQLGLKLKSVPQDLETIRKDLDSAIATPQEYVARVREVFVSVLQTQVDGQRESQANRRLAFASLDLFSPTAEQVLGKSKGMDLQARGACRSALDDLTNILASEEMPIAASVLSRQDSSSEQWLGCVVRDLEFGVFKSAEEFVGAVRRMLVSVAQSLGMDPAVVQQVTRLNDEVLQKSKLGQQYVKHKPLDFAGAVVSSSPSSPVPSSSSSSPVPSSPVPSAAIVTALPVVEVAPIATTTPIEVIPPPETPKEPETKQLSEVVEEEEAVEAEEEEEPKPKKKRNREDESKSAKKERVKIGDFSKETRQAALKAIAMMRREKAASQFLAPVDWKKFGLDDYPKVIQEPMDLGTLKQLVERAKITTVPEFMRLGKIIFENSLKYNHHDNPFENELRKQANECLKLFDKYTAQCLEVAAAAAAVDVVAIPIQDKKPKKLKKTTSPESAAAATPNKRPKKVVKSDEEEDNGDEDLDDELEPRVDPELKLTTEMETGFKDALKTLIRKPFASWFVNPVDLKVFTEYKRVCPKPMDLSLVIKRLESGKHYKRVADVVKDVQLIWQNCRAFNPEETPEFPILTDAKRGEVFFWKQIKQIVSKHTKKMEAIKASSSKLAQNSTSTNASATAALSVSLMPPITAANCRDPNTGLFKAPVRTEFALVNQTEELIRSCLATLSSTEQAKKYFGIPVLAMYDQQFGEAYKQLIAKPMDLQTCFIKLSRHEYQDETNGPGLVNTDVELIFANAKQFNVDNQEVLGVADHCKEFWLHIFTESFGTKEQKLVLAEKRNTLLFPLDASKSKYQMVLKKLTTKEMIKTDAKEFMHPVYSDSFILPDYHEVIKEPRDLTSITKTMEQDLYLTYGAFVRDVRLVFSNALLYNRAEIKENTPIRESAMRMSDLFESEWNKQSVVIYEYVLRKQEEERQKRILLGDAYVEEVRKPRKSQVESQNGPKLLLHHRPSYAAVDDMMSEDDNAKDEDDEEEVKFRKKKSVGGGSSSGGGTGASASAAASSKARAIAAAKAALHAAGDTVLSVSATGSAPPKKKKPRTVTATFAGMNDLDSQATAATALATAAAMELADSHAAAHKPGAGASAQGESQLGQFELETEIQSQARREYFRQHRAEQKKLRAMMRRGLRETYSEVIKNVRFSAMQRAEQQQQAALPVTGVEDDVVGDKTEQEVNDGGEDDGNDNDDNEGMAEPPSHFPLATTTVLPKPRRRGLFAGEEEEDKTDLLLLPSAPVSFPQEDSPLPTALPISSSLPLEWFLQLLSSSSRLVVFSKRFGAVTLYTLALMHQDDEDPNQGELQLSMQLPRALAYVENVFYGFELDLANAMRHAMAHGAISLEWELDLQSRCFISHAVSSISPQEQLRVCIIAPTSATLVVNNNQQVLVED